MSFRLLLFCGIAALLAISAATNPNPLLAAGSVSLITVLVLCPLLIPLLHRLKFGQSIRAEGPKSHQAKSGTPTMGGVAIIMGIVIGTLCVADISAEIMLTLFIMLGHFALGFLDDYLKVVKKQNLGLKAKQKFVGQIVIAIVTMIVARTILNIDTDLWVPLADAPVDLGVFYYPLVLFVMVGASNAVNLTDGLDGLAAGTVAVAMSAYAAISIATGADNLAVFAVATAAACVGFLAFNAHPAKVFMGDTGSLALGGAFAAMGILTHTEFLLAVVGVIFVAEALSVIIQVVSFQTTGKRVFRMSPLHHHFELGGWSEWKTVTVFWGVGLIAGIVGVLIYG